jgi:hypothetical protein
MVEPCLLAREIDVALDMDAVSFIFPVSVSVIKVKDRGSLLTARSRSSPLLGCLTSPDLLMSWCDPGSDCQFLFFDLLHPFRLCLALTISPHLYLPGLELQS